MMALATRQTTDFKVKIGHVNTKLVDLCRFLKIINCESRFLLPLPEMRNCELKNDSFLIPFTILLANNCDSFGIGIDTALV